MRRRTEEKIVVVTRETRVDNLRRRFNTIDQAAFFVKKRGGNFSDYQAEDANYKRSRQRVSDDLNQWGRVQFIDRSFLPNFVFGPADIVIAIGQDGLVANTLKYLRDGQPLLGVNPDPDRWDGALLPFVVEDLPRVVPEVLARRHREKLVTMGEARLNDGQQLLAVNDFFIGQRGHASARYLITSGDAEERHSSSGVIVSTGLGSTGWLTSLLGGATAIARELTGFELDVPAAARRLAWDEPKLVFTVREPFPSKTTQAELVFGEVSAARRLTIQSLMAENGVLFSDGVETDFIEFNSGSEVEISVSRIQGHLVA